MVPPRGGDSALVDPLRHRPLALFPPRRRLLLVRQLLQLQLRLPLLATCDPNHHLLLLLLLLVRR